MWKRRPKNSQRSKAKFKFTPFLGIGLCLLLVFFFAVGMLIKDLGGFLYANPQFNVSTVKLIIDGKEQPASSRAYYEKYLKAPVTTFGFDLAASRNRLMKAHPEAKSIRVYKAFPNEIIIEVINRKPIAQLKSGGRFYPVDRDGIILIDISQSPIKGLIVIIGAVQSGGPLEVGRPIKSKNFQRALGLLRDLSSSGLLNNYRVTQIDCVDASNLSFLFDNGIEVRIGDADYQKRLGALKGVLSKIKDTSSVDYIDLRFKDVVVGPR